MLAIASSVSFLQYVVDGLINGSTYGLIGISFGLIVAVTGRFHFAWASAYAIAGFFAAYLASHSGWSPVLAIVVSILGAVVFNLLCETLVYRPIAAKAGADASLLGIFVASFGITIAIENLITWVVGSANSVQTLNWISTKVVHIGSVTVTTLEIVVFATMWVCGVAMWGILRYGSFGRRIRAVQINPEMSVAVGIPTEWIYLLVFAISAVLGGIAAVLTSMRFAGTPSMGLTPVFYAFVVAFTAGLGRSPLRIMIVGTLIGIIEGISAEVLSVEWQQVIVFAILLIYLIFKAAYAWRPSLFTLPRATGSAAAAPPG
jgi:branched-chain amino acid transport system permease protein